MRTIDEFVLLVKPELKDINRLLWVLDFTLSDGLQVKVYMVEIHDK